MGQVATSPRGASSWSIAACLGRVVAPRGGGGGSRAAIVVVFSVLVVGAPVGARVISLYQSLVDQAVSEADLLVAGSTSGRSGPQPVIASRRLALSSVPYLRFVYGSP